MPLAYLVIVQQRL